MENKIDRFGFIAYSLTVQRAQLRARKKSFINFIRRLLGYADRKIFNPTPLIKGEQS